MTTGNPSNQAELPRNQIHFARGEVHLFVKHRPGMSAGEILKRIQDSKVLTPPGSGRANDPQGSGQGRPQGAIYYSVDRVWIFDPSAFETGRNDPQAYSLVFVSIPALDDEQKLLQYLRSLYRNVEQWPRRDDFEISQI